MKITTVNISQLPNLPKISEYDYFLKSQETGFDQIPYESQIISYSYLSANFYNNMRLQNLNMHGYWVFEKSPSFPLDIEKQTYSEDCLNSIAINKIYLKNEAGNLYNKIKKMILDLSAQIYDDRCGTKKGRPGVKRKIPTLKNQVIFSYLLTTEEEVKEKYGEKTEWVQIKNTFLLGADDTQKTIEIKNSNNQKTNYNISIGQDYTPESTVSFTMNLNNVPNHEAFTGNQYSIGSEVGSPTGFALRKEIIHWGKLDNCDDKLSKYMDDEYNSHGRCVMKCNPVCSNNIQKTYTPSTTFSVSNNNVTLSFSNASLQPITINVQRPPYVSIFIWKRTK